MLWARIPARTLPRLSACPPQARTFWLHSHRLVAGVNGAGPVAGFARHSRRTAARQRNRVGYRLPDTRTLRWDARRRGIPFRQARNARETIRQRKCEDLGMVRQCGEKIGGTSGQVIEKIGAAVPIYPRVGTVCGPPMPADSCAPTEPSCPNPLHRPARSSCRASVEPPVVTLEQLKSLHDFCLKPVPLQGFCSSRRLVEQRGR